MIAYTGETRAKALRAALALQGVGLVVQRGRVQKAAIRTWPRWFLDNLAWQDHVEDRAFDEEAFLRDVLDATDLPAGDRPDFVVLPDRVAGGGESLALSLAWLARLHRLALRFAIVVQDGMTPQAFPWEAPFHTVFVGGSTRWKLETAGAWIAAAHARDRRAHVGRVGTARRVRWARAIGADSIDSALPLWSDANRRLFEEALSKPVQSALPWGAPLVHPAFDR